VAPQQISRSIVQVNNVLLHRFHFRHLLGAAATAAVLGLPAAALASLGGTASTVEADRAQMNAKIQVAQHPNYEVHTIQAPGGTVVNEYLVPGGTVFAVAWHGQFPPQMQQILGTYFQQYTAALQAQARHYGHRPLAIHDSRLAVETAGHMRNYFGRAYIPDSLPQGLTVDEIQ
jgi:hypothetical protein